MKTLLSWTWFATCIFGAASIACAQDSQKLERAFNLINSLQVSGAQAEVVAQAKRDIAEVAQVVRRHEAEAQAKADEALKKAEEEAKTE